MVWRALEAAEVLEREDGIEAEVVGTDPSTDIAVLEIDPSNTTHLNALTPTWSPDGQSIVFHWTPSNQLWVMRADGSQGRDYTYVDDTVAGIVAALDHPSRPSIGLQGGSWTAASVSVLMPGPRRWPWRRPGRPWR